MSPAVTSLLAHLERELAVLPPKDLPRALAELERLRLEALPRLLAPSPPPSGDAKTDTSGGDRLLTTEQVAAVLAVKPIWVYRRAERLPFTRRLSKKALRFSEAGLQKWLAIKKA